MATIGDKLECQKCWHVWFQRTTEPPRQCPKCKSYKWADKKEEPVST